MCLFVVWMEKGVEVECLMVLDDVVFSVEVI